MRALPTLMLKVMVALILTAGCSNNTGPIAGALSVSLSSPHDDDGAVLLTVFGGPVDSVESMGYPLYSARAGGDTLKLIVTGNLGPGALARVHIPDSRQVSRYSARLTQAAARGTYAPHDPGGYTISLLP